MEIKITSTGLDKLTAQIEMAQDRIGDLDQVSDQVAQIIRDDINTRFILSPATTSGGMAYGGIEYKKLSNMAFRQNPAGWQDKFILILEPSGEEPLPPEPRMSITPMAIPSFLN